MYINLIKIIGVYIQREFIQNKFLVKRLIKLKFDQIIKIKQDYVQMMELYKFYKQNLNKLKNINYL